MRQQRHVDVIVVGGRVAGSALAARLGLYGLRVLLLERGTLPSLPAVSSPIIYAPTMRMLDEIGASEADYARDTPKIRHMVAVTQQFTNKMRIPEAKGRDYGYAIDRARFDAALWDNAVRLDNVTGWQGFNVLDLLWDADRVTGVRGKDADGQLHEISADVVIGADGRFGVVARKAGAEIRDRYEAHPTSIYYAYWEGVAPFDADGPSAAAYEGSAGYGYLVMDSAAGQTAVAVEGRADVVDPQGQGAEAFYLDLLQQNAALWSRLEGAQQVTSVRGMRHVSNLYHSPGGPGWALVGDAYHQKDPLDGQGIYNAVVTGKALAQTIRKWRSDDTLTWAQALDEYDRIARVKTYPMYKALQTRIRQSFYASGESPLPEPMMATMGRWISEDPAVNRLLGAMLTRDLPPDLVTLLTPPTLIGAMARGPLRDLRRRVGL